jgi:hypothetical protein
MTNAEKMMTVMLAEILEGIKTKGEIEPEFVKEQSLMITCGRWSGNTTAFSRTRRTRPHRKSHLS